MTTHAQVLAQAALLDHLPRATMTAAQVADFNEGRAMAEALAAEARKPGAPALMIFAAWGHLLGRDAAIVGFAQRLQQLLAEVPHANA